MAKLLETLFIESIERWVKGNCFICKQKCQDDAYCHETCSFAYWDEKQKRLDDGYEHAAKYNWDTAAQETMEVFRSVLS